MNINYEEILKCYHGETDDHATTSFEFGLMNDLYYQLFYKYDSAELGTYYTPPCIEGTSI